MSTEMERALVADGEKLRQLTGEDHGPFFIPSDWTIETALPLIRRIEEICPAYGCHVALTGGTLYKFGPRKDLDLIFYRIRQFEEIAERGLLKHLEDEIGLVIGTTRGWVTKATYNLQKLDLFFPERSDKRLKKDGSGYYA